MAAWKKKLNRELDELVRALPSEFAPAENEPAAVKSNHTRTVRITAAVTACALLFGVLLPVVMSGLFMPNTGGVVLMEMNSAVRLYTDADGSVLSVYSENGNGDILLSDSEFAESLCGMSAEDAAQKLAGRAFAAGLVREGENAVRITVAADKNSSAKELQTVLESSVIGYFCEKGAFVPVLGRTAELSAFGKEDTAREMAEAGFGTPFTVTERLAAATPLERVEASYRNSLLLYTKEVTEYVYRTVRGKQADLKKIDALNREIMDHSDNTLSLPYWLLVTNIERTDSLAALLVRMENELADYELRYGQSLNEPEQYLLFLALDAFYENFDLFALRRGIDDLLSVIEYFTGIFDPSAFIGLISADDAMEEIVSALFEGIGDLPDSVGSYVDTALKMLQRETKLSLFENRAEAEKQRPTISYEGYRAKMEELFGKFENFEDFWNSFQ